MKKCITQVAAIVLGLAIGSAAASARADTLKLAPNAPDKYVVVKGDTLWDISGRFLEKPWRWPEIWQLNREAIKDPHWIYPGDIVYLDESGGTPRLRLGRAIGGEGMAMRGDRNGAASTRIPGATTMSPRVREKALDADAIPTIPLAAIEPFLNKPLIVEVDGLKLHPRIVATQEGRVYVGRDDKAYVRGIEDESVTDWHIYRQSRPILDPDTKQPIAWEVLHIGSATLERQGDPSTMRIYNTSEEVGIGDRLMPATASASLNFAPRPPERDVNGRIVNVHRGVSQIGKNSVVAINRGEMDGVEVGNVLQIQQLGRTIVDRETKDRVKLPDEPVGHMLVFRVFDRIAYGLVMDAATLITVGDTVVKP